MGESTERERQKEWADELRSEIDDLRHGVDDPSRPKSARELTDEAAAKASQAQHSSAARDDDDPR